MTCEQCGFHGICQSENAQKFALVKYWTPAMTEILRRKKIEKTVENSVANSTCHGFAQCLDKEHAFRRWIWIMMLFVCVGFSLQKVHGSLNKYFSYPFNTKVTIIYADELPFPAVSVCNLNDLRMSVLNGTLLYDLLEHRKHSGEGLNLSTISGDMYRNITQGACHQIQHMLVECKMLGKKCTFRDFRRFYQKQGECCYTINGPQSTIVTVDKSKKSKSFEFEFNIENYEYYDEKAAGLRLILHDQKETPVSMRGDILPPGFTSFVKIKKSVTRNLKSPFKTKCDSKPLHHFTYYSQSACELEELTHHLVDKCKCKDEFMPGTGPTCSIQQLVNCTWPAWETFSKIPTRCPISCKAVHFDPILSFGQYPSNVRADAKAKEYRLSGTAQENRQFIRDNFLRVEISYESMAYSLVEQSPSYDFMVLLGDIGGQLGLFLGTSILTFVEFLDLFLMVIYIKYFEHFGSYR